MDQLPMGRASREEQPRSMARLLAAMSLVTMAMTIPQVWVVWVDRESAGVSLLSWSAYSVSAALWFVHGLQKGDKNIYLACIGWLALDVAIIVGVLANDGLR